MTLNTSTRIPVDDAYAALLGKAVYVFAYYEWTIIYIIECLENGFVARYSRGKSMVSGNVRCEFQKIIRRLPVSFNTDFAAELQTLCDRFEELIIKRNALIHAHPTSDENGTQILIYQTNIAKPLPDMTWRKLDLEQITAEFDLAACQAGSIFDRIR
jgi:hypothetical protein